MKKLLLIALLLVPQMHAMQMGDQAKTTQKKYSNSSCCGTAVKALCLGALLASGQAQATASNAGAGRESAPALDDVCSERWAGNAGDAGNLAPLWFDMSTVGLARDGAFVFINVNVRMLAHDLAIEAIEGTKDCQGDEPGKVCLRNDICSRRPSDEWRRFMDGFKQEKEKKD
jgi:hypothetical protein